LSIHCRFVAVVVPSRAPLTPLDCCYKPARFLTPEVEARRTEAWEKKLNSTHDPISFIKLPRKVPETHHTYKESCERALQEPVLTARGRQLVGLDKY
jgi:hypothetical protein